LESILFSLIYILITQIDFSSKHKKYREKVNKILKKLIVSIYNIAWFYDKIECKHLRNCVDKFCI